MSTVATLTFNPALDLTVEIDELIPYRKLRERLAALHPGGGGVNVARVLHRFGTPVLAIAPLGGSSGAALRECLEREGVPVHSVHTTIDTRRSVTLWVGRTREHFRILVEGEPLPEAAWRACLEAVAAAGAPAFVVLSGSLPPGVPVAVVGELAEHARAIGARLICDLSGPALAAAAAARVDLIKPSARELRELVGSSEPLDSFDHRRAARSAVALGARAVVVSLGADGAFLATADGTEVAIAAPPIRELSSAGAGDSMVAGIVLGLLQGRSLPDAMRFGVAAGAATCEQHGTELCLPSEVARLDAQLAQTNPRP